MCETVRYARTCIHFEDFKTPMSILVAKLKEAMRTGQFSLVNSVE